MHLFILLELLCHADSHLFALRSFCAPFCTSFFATFSPREYFALDTFLHITHVFNESAQLRGGGERDIIRHPLARVTNMNAHYFCSVADPGS
jgi:hypothetical protein